MDILAVANNDNLLGNIYPDDKEHVIEINGWNNTKILFKTVDCKHVFHQVELIDEIGDILVTDGLYRFLTPDGEDMILEIEAAQIVQIK